MMQYQQNHRHDPKLGHKKAILSPEEKADLQSKLELVPPKFMSPDFKLDSEVFKIKTQEEAQEINDTLSHYLEVIELNLACTIQDNFEEFHKAFKGFGAMKRDLDLI